MSIIQRPGKEGNATTYQGKVAAGYLNILAQEVDADIDAIYSAWNAGVDTVNIKDGSVSASKLAPGAVTGTSLAPGSITAPALAAGSVTSAAILNGTIVAADIAPATLTDSLIANVAWTKLIAPYTGSLKLAPGGSLDATGTTLDLYANNPSDPGYDGSKPTWLVRLDYTNDQVAVYRAPPPGTAFVAVLGIASNGVLTCTLAANSVNRNQLGVNAIIGAGVAAVVPAGVNIAPNSGWTTVVSLPAITTRGGFVHLFGNHSLSVSGQAAGSICGSRWLRSGTNVTIFSFMTTSTAYVPFPGVNYIDNPPAGTWTYSYQASTGAGAYIVSSGNADSAVQALEIG